MAPLRVPSQGQPYERLGAFRHNLKPFTRSRFPDRNRQGLVLNVQASFTSRNPPTEAGFVPSDVALLYYKEHGLSSLEAVKPRRQSQAWVPEMRRASAPPLPLKWRGFRRKDLSMRTMDSHEHEVAA
jgi:hypothetical protein